jgi:lysophospholipase L1-like esterase
LTRRSFSGGSIAKNLENERKHTIQAAEAGKFPYIDLNMVSTTYVEKIGQASADKYNLKDGDRTHLNKHGSDVFGRMVADLISEKIPALASAFVKDEKTSAAIKAGKFV